MARPTVTFGNTASASPYRPILIILIAGVLLEGCAHGPTGLYDWGEYEDSVYTRYTNHDFGLAEKDVYSTLPQPGHTARVPPGVYADYGFLLYRRGDYAGALSYFEKEKATYPESSLLMTKLINRVREKTGQPATAPTPAPPEAGKGTAPIKVTPDLPVANPVPPASLVKPATEGSSP
jgi:hypothetical protein